MDLADWYDKYVDRITTKMMSMRMSPHQAKIESTAELMSAMTLTMSDSASKRMLAEIKRMIKEEGILDEY